MKAGRRGRLLLVDDEPRKALVYVQAFESEGFTVVVAGDVDGALRAISEPGRFEVIVLDVMMPPGRAYSSVEAGGGLRTGCLLARDLKARAADTPIVVLTNVGDDAVLREIRLIASATLLKFDFPPTSACHTIIALLRRKASGLDLRDPAADTQVGKWPSLPVGTRWSAGRSRQRVDRQPGGVPGQIDVTQEGALLRIRERRDGEAFSRLWIRLQGRARKVAREYGVDGSRLDLVIEATGKRLWEHLEEFARVGDEFVRAATTECALEDLKRSRA